MRFMLPALSVLLLAVPAFGQKALPADSAAVETVPPDFSFTILAPQPDSTVPGGEPLEVSLLLPEISEISVSLILDGKDVSGQAEVASGYLFAMLEPPPPGPHRLRVAGLSAGDTAFAESWTFSVTGPETLPGPQAQPWEITFGLGCQYADCDRDTAGLGLATPTGLHPLGDASLSGPAWGGLVQGYVSYDPTYDSEPHGLLQLSTSRLDVSLGEFSPDLSSLAFAGALPTGLLGRGTWGRLSLDLTACRTASADTSFGAFAQYLYGGQVRGALPGRASLGLGYLRGQDVPASLPDSVRFKTSTFVYSDTVFGLTDTLVTVDSLHALRNQTGWLWAHQEIGGYWFRLEAAGSRTEDDTGGTDRGAAYLLELGRNSGPVPFSLAFSSAGYGFRCFGNPYLEAAKRSVRGESGVELGRGLRLAADAGLYKVLSDSTPGLGFSAGIGGAFHRGPLSLLSLRLDYQSRPYSSYLYQCRGLSASLGLSAAGFRLSSGYSYSSSSSPGTTQSHDASFEVARSLLRSLASGSLGYQYCQSRDDAGSSNQEKQAFTASVGGDLTGAVYYRLQGKRTLQADHINPSRSYRQNAVSAHIGYRI